jgi:uncharacterized protein (TIGR02058 family)
MLRTLEVDTDTMEVNVTVGVQKLDAVDLDAVKAALPVGKVSVAAVKGGLDVADPEADDMAVIASAAVEVRLELP